MKHILNNLSEEVKNSIREQHTGGKKIMTERFNKLSNSKLGDAKPLIEQDNKVPEVINKVASEGIKNVLPQMISSPQFKGDYSGYNFGGVFNGTNYRWDCNGVEGMSGVRGLVDGEILTETVENMLGVIKKQVTDAKPGSPCVGFYAPQSSVKFIIYTTNGGKVKCLNF